MPAAAAGPAAVAGVGTGSAAGLASAAAAGAAPAAGRSGCPSSVALLDNSKTALPQTPLMILLSIKVDLSDIVSESAGIATS